MHYGHVEGVYMYVCGNCFCSMVLLCVWSSAALFSVVRLTYLANTMMSLCTDHTHSLQSKIYGV